MLNGLPTMKARAQESERLIEWAFREFNNYRLFSPGDKVDDAEVWLGAEPKVPLTVAKDLIVTLPRKARKDMEVTAALTCGRWVLVEHLRTGTIERCEPRKPVSTAASVGLWTQAAKRALRARTPCSPSSAKVIGSATCL